MYGGLYRRGGHFIYSMGDYVLGGGGDLYPANNFINENLL